MSNYIEILKLAFEVLMALLLMGMSIFLVQHYRKGEDITSLTFAISSFSLAVVIFVTVILSISINSFSLFSSYTYSYIPWFIAGGYLFFSIGVFISVFLSKKKMSFYFMPFVLLLFVILGIGFIPQLYSGLPEFISFGVWLLLLTGIVLFAVSLNYFLYWVREKQNYRLKMSLAFLILAVSMFVSVLIPSSGPFWFLSHLLRLIGFGIVFYEFQVGF